MKNYQITLFGCDNKHSFKGYTTEDYFKSQKVDLAKIKCDICKSQNKSESYNNMFYQCCQCNQLLCPLCKNKHDKSHSIINYDDKCFICEKHGEYYTKYCDDCQINLCRVCEPNHQTHKLIYFIDIMHNNKQIIVNSLDELKTKIDKFKEDIDNIKKLYDNLLKNLETNYNILKNIVDVYDDNDYKKKNYQIIQTMNDIKDFSSDIKNDLDQVINNSDMYYKMRSIVKLFYKTFPENGFDIGYTINKNEKEIRVFGDDFVKNNKNNNCIIEYEGEEIELQEKLKIKNFDNDVIIIKLKNVNNITNMKGMFSGCLSLKYLHRLSSINTSKVVNMSAMFYNCSQLEKIDSILDLDISNVTDISGMFGGCSSLVEICDISNWDTSNIINMNGLFGNCSSLKKYLIFLNGT
jgi:surface protein